MNPHILYWKWSDDTLDEAVMREKATDIINNSIFDCIYICFHSVSLKNRILSSDKGVNAIKKCVKLFAEYGRKVVIDTEFDCERNYIQENLKDRMCFVKTYSAKLEHGKLIADAEGADRLLRCWAVDFVSETCFKNPVDITDCCKIENGSAIIDSDMDDRGVIYCLASTTEIMDAFSDEYDPARRLIFEKLKDIPLAGAATDEMGIGFDTKAEQTNPNEELSMIDHLDINKVNYYCDRINYSDSMSLVYEKRYGESLIDNLLYFWYTQKGNEGKSIRTVNNYVENIRIRCAEIEKNLYDLTKEFFGDDAYVLAHPTWWGDELDNNFDAYYNGLDWWETKRDYAQTDELVLIPIRLAMARKCSKNIWYNMWYSMRTLDIKSYYKETYTNVIYGGRTHHLGYECNEPGVVLCLNEGTMLSDLSEMEKKVGLLDQLQKSRPDSRVLVMFGYEAATNHFISDPGQLRLNRRGTAIHTALKTTKELFDYPYLCELVPTSELDNGYVKLDGGKAAYCGHEYDAVVLLCPDGMTKSAYDKLNVFDENGGKLIVCGDINVFHDGTLADNAVFKNALYHSVADAAEIASDLKAYGIKQNKGDNYCVFEDGSVTISNPYSKNNTENGVKCDIYNVSEEKADIVFIASNGSRTVI